MIKFFFKQVNSGFLQLSSFISFCGIFYIVFNNIEHSMPLWIMISILVVYFFNVIVFLILLINLNIRAMYYISKNRKVSKIFTQEDFTLRQWSELLGLKLTYYEKILILKVFVSRGTIIQEGKFYSLQENNLD